MIQETEMKVATFHQKQNEITLLFATRRKGQSYKLFHARQGSIREHLFKKQYARVIMRENDEILILSLRPGFPSLRLCCKNGIIQTEGSEYLDLEVGDVEEMSKFP